MMMNSFSLGMFSLVAGKGSSLGGSGVAALTGQLHLSGSSSLTSVHLLTAVVASLSADPTSGKFSGMMPRS